MAEKMNEKDEVKMNGTAGRHPRESGLPSVVAADDMFSAFDPGVDTEEDEQAGLPVSDVFATGTYMFRKARKGKNGETYYDYVAGFVGKIGGNPVTNTISFKLAKEYREAYDRLNMIFGSENRTPLYILRTEMTDNRTRRTTVSYQAQVSVKDDDGDDFCMQLRPSNAIDRMQFEYMLDMLRKRGVVR